MASNVESNEARQERVRRQREHYRLSGERETNEEREARLCKRKPICTLSFAHLCRLARHREYDRKRCATITISQREENLSRRNERGRLARQNQTDEERQTRFTMQGVVLS